MKNKLKDINTDKLWRLYHLACVAVLLPLGEKDEYKMNKAKKKLEAEFLRRGIVV